MQIIKKTKLHGLAKDLTGKRYGKLKVLSYCGSSRRGGTVWNCVCDCGVAREVMAFNLTKGLTKTCGCSRKGNKNHNWKGYKNISGNRWNDIVQNAKSRNLSLEITIKDAYNLFQKQNGLCALTKIRLELGKGIDRGTASLDRIDSSMGYTKDNVQWVHKDINRMKNSYSQEYFIHMCKMVAR